MMKKRLTALVVSMALVASIVPCAGAAEEAAVAKEPGGGAVAAAVVSDIPYITGKVVTCTLGAGLWTASMFLTFGVIYAEAGKFVAGCCGGKWVITPTDMANIR